MYRFYALLFFTLNVALLVVAFINSKILFLGNILMYVIFLFAVAYISFVLLLILNTFFQVRKDKLVSKLLTPFLKKLKVATDKLDLVRSSIVLFWVLFISVIAICAGFRGFAWLMATAFKDQLGAISAVIASPNNSLSKLVSDTQNIKDRLDQMDTRYYSDLDTNFFEKNKKVYTYELTHYKAVLFNTSIPSYGDSGSNSRYYTYSISVCPLVSNTPTCITVADEQGVLAKQYLYDSTNRGNTMLKVDISNGEVITDFWVKPYIISGVKDYIYLGTVQTNQRQLPFILYPQNSGAGSEYRYVEFLNNIDVSSATYVKDIPNGVSFRFDPPELSSGGLPIYVDILTSDSGVLVSKSGDYGTSK